MAGRDSGVPGGKAETIAVSRWRFVCVNALAELFAIFSVLLVYGAEGPDGWPIPFQYPFTNDHGTAAAIISRVQVRERNDTDKDPIPKGETGQKLRVTVREGPDFQRQSSYNLKSAMRVGSADTDSCQCAVRWSKQGATEGNPAIADVGHDTNSNEPKGAKWPGLEGTEMDKNQTVWWETDVPTLADHVEVVVVYTDVLYNRNVTRQQAYSRYGDVPVVVAAWWGDKQEGNVWTFTRRDGNDGDVFLHQDTYPADMTKINEFTEKAQGVVRNRTGYTLKARPGKDAEDGNTGFDIEKR